MDSEHPLGALYTKRVKQNRDLVVLITDSSNDRGTGKTTLALKLAAAMDRTDAGLTPDKTSIEPEPLTNAYTDHPKGSALVLDESEVGMDKYQAASAVNTAIRELVSMGRVQQKYLILNAPADHLVDSDLKSLVDVWVLVERRGFAKVYRMDWEPMSGHELTRKLGTLNWDAISDSQVQRVYQHLTEEKNDRLDGESGGDYVTRQEMRERVESEVEDTKQTLRDQWIRTVYQRTNLDQQDVADLPMVDLSRSRVSRIAGETKAEAD